MDADALVFYANVAAYVKLKLLRRQTDLTIQLV